MAKKLLLIVAILCLLIPFFVLGTVSANAEQLTYLDNNSNTRYLNVGRFQYQDSPLSYYWAGSPQFALTTSTQPSFYHMGASYGVPQFDFDLKGFDLSINNAFQFATTNGVASTINFTIEDDFQHSIFILVNYVSGYDNGVVDNAGSSARDLAYNGQFHLSLNGMSLNSYSYNMYMGNFELQSGITYALGFGNPNYSTSSLAPDFFLTAVDINTGASEVAVEGINNFMVYAFSVGRGSYTISSTSLTPDNMYMLCVFDYWLVSDGYQQGYDVGYTAANNTIRPGSPNYVAGQQNANNTVNVNSASYQAGYQAGLEVPEYSFLTLISAVLDAPIRALFGFTDSEGVIHPGLFNIEFLGINMASFILSLFTFAIIITVIRLILGGK